MANLGETRISLLYAYDSSIINDEEFILVYDINTAKSPDFPYRNYKAFELDSMCPAMSVKWNFTFIRMMSTTKWRSWVAQRHLHATMA